MPYITQFFHHFFARFWVLCCAILVLIPLSVIASSFGDFDAEIWQFLLEHELALLIKNTAVLSALVAVGVLFLGSSSAWLTATYQFPAQRFFFWAMMLPLAMPVYVLAFVQLGVFEYSSWFNQLLMQYGFEAITEVKNVYVLAIAMSLTLYPYVYLLARNAFSGMGNRALEVGASLGLSPVQSFFKIALPSARPWLAGGVILALMEVLADFGAVSIFGYSTFTTAIYDAWFGFFSIETAQQLAVILISVVFVFIALEQISRGKQRFQSVGRTTHHQRKILTGWKKYFATTYCSLILLLAFILPIIQLLAWAVRTWQATFNADLLLQIWHSFFGSLIAAFLVASIALFLALAKRSDHGRFTQILSRIAILGYTIPGAVLAVGVFVPVAWLDNFLIAQFNLERTAVFKGTLLVMLLAYVIRFLALGHSSISAGLERISRSQIEAAKSLGQNDWQILWSVYLPLLKGSIGVAMILVFVDVMKEMPMTLMTRPYDWDTLAVRIYNFTMESLYNKAAVPALIIVLVGLIPVVLFSKLDEKS
ncbi:MULTISPECIES: ABC transporter permease [unclassified Acinetobacter]|uniref:ABC transporter permease n=1 Tax=unclassified Acinetobacter TaxID=196816 RepID=UPI0035B6DE6F